MWLEVLVQENGIARLTRFILQWQGDEITEAATGQGVLIGEQAVIGTLVHLMAALEMIEEDLTGERQKGLIRALAAFHPGLFANATYPFIAASWRIPFSTGLCAYPKQWKYIIPAAE